MVTLIFQSTAIPRTTSRKEWHCIWRWKRITEKALAEALKEQIANLQIYGTTLPQYIKDDMIDRIVNPPIMIYPEAKRW